MQEQQTLHGVQFIRHPDCTTNLHNLWHFDCSECRTLYRVRITGMTPKHERQCNVQEA